MNEKRNFVNLNINPCKMCMPMGAALSLKGIENCIMLLHGSQGCSTYIRRHMAGHFNEPIDIASSSLNEKGTVYGGEKNLVKSLDNVIKVYNPQIIGVATTCLAETIGEDIGRIIREYKENNQIKNREIVPIPTPGYGGSEFEGYFVTLKAIVEHLVNEINIKPIKEEYINIIVGNMSSGDVRNLKRILGLFDIKYIMYPDISETLDAPFLNEYNSIPKGGTKLEDIKRMINSKGTIEFSMTIQDNISPGKYLEDKFGVKLFKCPIPVGIENTDRLIDILKTLSKRDVPDEIKNERGRLLDAMVDSHKFNGEGVVTIYGEPDLSFAIGDICKENGIKTALISTGTNNEYFKNKYKNISDDKTLYIDEIDFETIEDYSKKLGVNVAIGNSEGKVLSERLKIPVVRVGFPINDRIGGQRIVITGYNGSIQFLDRITNTIIEKRYENYRTDMYQKYFEENNEKEENNIGIEDKRLKEKTLAHPCYSGKCSNARMHLPVAPKCNIQCRYCNRKYDCVNESRPGVTSEILSPDRALNKFIEVKKRLKNLSVVGIAGPGDALADFENTKDTIEKIKKEDPNITFCVSTNGLMLPYYAKELIDMGIEHLTVTVNTVDSVIGAKIYKYINFMGVKFEGEKGANLLLENQLAGIKIFAALGGVVKVNIVMIEGINNDSIEDVVKKVKECGAYMTNIMPLIPAPGSDFEDVSLTNGKELNKTQKKCENIIKQMYHCKQCRADAIGTLDNDISAEFRTCKKISKNIETSKNSEIDVEYKFAVATDSRIYVDRHFGKVDEFHIYKYINGEVIFYEKRKIKKYCDNDENCENEDTKIKNILKVLEDCTYIMIQRIGDLPKKTLEIEGKIVIQTCLEIEEAIKEQVLKMVRI
ncbi:MAG: nitrogenase cofactor biosynthesis protein NifB [Clostridiales bacterium]